MLCRVGDSDFPIGRLSNHQQVRVRLQNINQALSKQRVVINNEQCDASMTYTPQSILG